MRQLALRLVETPSAATPRPEPRADRVRVVHALPGRVRYHLPLWDGGRAFDLENALLRAPGVVSAEANPATRNVLVCFDLFECDEAEVRRAVDRLAQGAPRVIDGETTRRRRKRGSAGGRPGTQRSRTPSRQRQNRALGVPADTLLPNVPKILLLILSCFTTRTPVGLTILGLDWLDLAIRLGFEAG
jgi:hypothetical protein